MACVCVARGTSTLEERASVDGERGAYAGKEGLSKQRRQRRLRQEVPRARSPADPCPRRGVVPATCPPLHLFLPPPHPSAILISSPSAAGLILMTLVTRPAAVAVFVLVMLLSYSTSHPPSPPSPQSLPQRLSLAHADY
jgi:hypothetical protein